MNVEWVGEGCLHASVSALLTAGNKRVSLVECASFEMMRQIGIDIASPSINTLKNRTLT
jgi:hypothetical protein